MSNQISAIKTWFNLAVPEPTPANQTMQLGCHYEEVAEMAEVASFWKATQVALEAEATRLKESAKDCTEEVWGKCESETDGQYMDRRIHLLDALCDQIVTATGVAHMFGLDIEGALAEVIRSNYSKFVDGKPVFDANGKIAKPASYSPPDLTAFV